MIQCQSDGLLNSKSPQCFEKQSACMHNNSYFPEGTNLSCNKTGFGFTLVTCEQSLWQDQSLYNSPDGKSCKENISSLTFQYQDVNAVILQEINNAFTIEEFVDFCKQNPKDPECTPVLPTCEYEKQIYQFGHVLHLKCPKIGNKEVMYQCFENWIFTGYKDTAYFFEPSVYIQDCGSGAEITLSLPPTPPNSRSNQKPQSMQDAKMQKLKSTLK